jgi:hypothetical protein
MGIRCYCPNGHKLHLKSHLAGKKGICPECGAKFRIPLTDADEPALGLPDKPSPSATPWRKPATEPPPDFDFSFPDPGAGHALASKTAVVPQVASPIPAAAPARGDRDPIDELPQAVWYVRTPVGEQYGPVQGAAMRSWVAEGRVTNESYVWREGWPDWRPARDVFGNPSKERLAPARPVTASPAVAVAANPLQPLNLKPSPASGRPNSVRASSARARSARNSTLTFVILLGLVCVLLLAALVWVLQGGR